MTSGDALSWSAAFERLAGLALLVEAVDVEYLERPSAAGGLRRTAVVRLSGGGVEGLGEEVTFQPEDVLRTRRRGRTTSRPTGHIAPSRGGSRRGGSAGSTSPGS